MKVIDIAQNLMRFRCCLIHNIIITILWKT